MDDDVVNNDTIVNNEYKKENVNELTEAAIDLRPETLAEISCLTTRAAMMEHCSKLGIRISSAMSMSDLIVSLRNKLVENYFKSGENIDGPEMMKFFTPFRSTSGGLLTASCAHGIIYAIKFLLRAESSRDVMDILKSMKYPPSVVIYDNADNLARHADKCYKNFFGPNLGRAVEASKFNIERAEYSISSKKTLFDEPVSQYGRLALYDKFHQGNSKKESAILRRVALFKDLKNLNTQVAEQLNSQILHKVGSWTQMTPSLFIHNIHRFAHLWNQRKNENLKLLTEDIALKNHCQVLKNSLFQLTIMKNGIQHQELIPNESDEIFEDYS
jgi:hypothetical protein